MRDLARAAYHDTRLILIVVAHADQLLRTELPEEAPSTLKLAHWLVRRDLATVVWLAPLTPEDVVESLPEAPPEIGQALHTLAGGSALWVERLWADWVQREFVVRGTDRRWRRAAPSTEAGTAAQARRYAGWVLRRALGRRGSDFTFTFEEVAELLCCAALEGQTFTADAVAAVGGYDRDDVQDFFDEVLCGEEGLLAGAGFVPLRLADGAFRSDLYCYRFRPAAAHYVFKHYPTPPEERQLAYRMADALEHLYWPFPDRIPTTLHRLYRLGGDVDPDAEDGGSEVEQERAARRRTRMEAYGRMHVHTDAGAALRFQVQYWQKYGEDLDGRRRLAGVQFDLAEWLFQRSPSEALEVVAQAADTAASAGWHTLEVIALESLGSAQLQLAQLEEVRLTAERLRARAEALDLEWGQASAWKLLGRVADELSAPQEASAHLRRALAIYQRVGHNRGQALTLASLGDVARSLGSTDEALTCYQAALELFELIGDVDGVTKALSGQAFVAWMQGAYVKSRDYYRRMLAIVEGTGRDVSEAQIHAGLGHVTQSLGAFEEAKAHYLRALAIEERLGRDIGMAGAIGGLGDVARLQGAIAEARAHYGRALALYRQLNMPADVATLQGRLAKLDERE